MTVAAWPTFTLPESVSLSPALIWRVERFVRVMNAVDVAVVAAPVVAFVVGVDVPPPGTDCPTTPLRVATVPSAGARRVVSSRAFWAVSTATWADATLDWAAARSPTFGGWTLTSAAATAACRESWALLTAC